MTVAPAETSIRRLGLRQRSDWLHSSDALRDLLAEFALWTALWIGFPLFNDLDVARKQRSQA